MWKIFKKQSVEELGMNDVKDVKKAMGKNIVTVEQIEGALELLERQFKDFAEKRGEIDEKIREIKLARKELQDRLIIMKNR